MWCPFYPIHILLLKFSQWWDDNREIAPSFGRTEREEQHFLQSLLKEVLLSKIFQLEFAQVSQSSHHCSLKGNVRTSGWICIAWPRWDCAAAAWGRPWGGTEHGAEPVQKMLPAWTHWKGSQRRSCKPRDHKTARTDKEVLNKQIFLARECALRGGFCTSPSTEGGNSYRVTASWSDTTEEMGEIHFAF